MAGLLELLHGTLRPGSQNAVDGTGPVAQAHQSALDHADRRRARRRATEPEHLPDEDQIRVPGNEPVCVERGDPANLMIDPCRTYAAPETSGGDEPQGLSPRHPVQRPLLRALSETGLLPAAPGIG
jgi:hypothetical protein